MKAISFVVAIALVSAIGCHRRPRVHRHPHGKASTSASASAGAAIDLDARARAFTLALSLRDFDGAAKSLDDVMAAAMPTDKLGATWDAVVAQHGAFRAITATHAKHTGKFETIRVTCAFERDALDLKIVYDADARIAGLWLVKPEVAWDPPAYADASKVHEEPIEVGDQKLEGTLTLPNAPSAKLPAIVLVHGSGPNDRDETDGQAKPFKDLAWGLASRGVAVLRYEKRTRAHPEQFAETAQYTVKEEAIDDARAAVALLSRRADVDPKRIYVLGHSLGGTLAPRIAKGDSDVAGVIVLAGASRPLQVLLVEQVRYLTSLPGVPADAAKEAIERALATQKAIERKDLAPTDVVDFLGSKGPGAYWLDLRDYRPAEVAATLGVPILILQGARDYQVTKPDYDGWAKALEKNPNAKLTTFPKLDHLFIEGEGPSTPADYERPGLHVSPDVIDAIAKFVLPPQ